MKRLFHICSIMVVSFLLFSCAGLNSDSGRITINLPGTTSAREIGESNVSLIYDITVTAENFSKAETDYAESSYSLELEAGKYKIEVLAKNKETKKELFNGSAEFEVVAGNESNVTVEMKKVVIPTVKITFDANGGEGEQQSVTAEKDQSVKLPECTFKITGKSHFVGWSTDKEGKTKIEAGKEFTLSDNTVLYAIWEKNPAAGKVQFSKTVATGNTIEVEAGTKVELTCETKDVKIYYKLNDDKDWTLYDAAKPITIEKDTTITAYAESDYYNAGEEVKYTYKISVKPSAAKVQVVYADTGKAVEGTKLTVVKGTKLSITCETKDADLYYQVEGDKDATKFSKDKPIEITKKCTISFWSEGEKYIASDKVKIEFDLVVYKVTFDANGGTGTQEAVSTDSDGKFKTPECKFKPTGKKHFAGWTADKEKVTKIEAGKEMTVSKDTVLYAIWEDNPAAEKVEFSDSEGNKLESGKVAYGTKVKLSSATTEASIYYITKIGTAVSEEKKYDSAEPIEIKADMSIEAYAISDYYNKGEVSSIELQVKKMSIIVIDAIEKVEKDFLYMQVDTGSEINVKITVSPVSKEVKNYVWLLNGKKAETETIEQDGEVISIISINSNEFVITNNLLLNCIKNTILMDQTNILTCIAEMEDGTFEDISYSFYVTGA